MAFPDFPQAATDGETLAEALSEADDCVEEALAGRIIRQEDILAPAPATGRPMAVPGAVMVTKTALYEALRQEGLSKSALARVIGIQESEVRRMLNPKHPAKIGRLEKALSRVGKRLVVAVEQAP